MDAPDPAPRALLSLRLGELAGEILPSLPSYAWYVVRQSTRVTGNGKKTRVKGIDLPENYRNWTFRIESGDAGVVLSVTEDNIPDETKRARSDEFWSGVLATIKGIVEARTR